MMLVGGVINANTVLQPEFMQELLGYNATTAGLALTAGGLALVIMMPLAGIATGKVAARTLAVCGFSLFAITFRYAAYATSLQMSFAQNSWLRVIQLLPLPFCFISITNAAYVGMAKEESNQVAGLINFVRNLGGSILIAITNAQVTSRAMWHQQHLQTDMAAGSPIFAQRLRALTGFLGGHFGPGNGGPRALASMYNQLNQQAQLQGFQDVYIELSWMSCCLIVLAFMLSRNRPGQGAGAGAAMH
jgi:DHA2 family multidrug resistance protein